MSEWDSDTISRQAEIQGQSVETNISFSFLDFRLSDSFYYRKINFYISSNSENIQLQG